MQKKNLMSGIRGSSLKKIIEKVKKSLFCKYEHKIIINQTKRKKWMKYTANTSHLFTLLLKTLLHSSEGGEIKRVLSN